MSLSPPLARALVWLGLAVGLSGPLVVVAAVAGRVFGLLDWRTAFETMTLGAAPALALAGLAGGAVALVAAIWARPRWMWGVAVLALAAPLVVLAGVAGQRAMRERTPPIHDVATNWEDPLVFSRALLDRRGQDAAAVERDPQLAQPWSPAGVVREGWAPRRVADINRLTCPGARPVGRLVPAAEVQRVLEEQGLIVGGAAPWRVEGTARSFWFHREDDVAVRMRPGRTDVRSVSRVAAPDGGVNCARVTAIVRALQAGG